MAKPAPIPSCRDSQATLSFTALHKELGYTFSLCMTISYLIERKRVKVNARIKIIYMKRALLSLRSVHALSPLHIEILKTPIVKGYFNYFADIFDLFYSFLFP